MVEPSPFPPMSIVLGGVLIPDGTRCVSSVNGNLAAAVLSPGGMFVSGNRRKKEVILTISIFFLPTLIWVF